MPISGIGQMPAASASRWFHFLNAGEVSLNRSSSVDARLTAPLHLAAAGGRDASIAYDQLNAEADPLADLTPITPICRSPWGTRPCASRTSATSRAPVHCVDVTHVTKAHDGACARPSTQAFCPPCTVPLRSGLLERTRQRHSLVLEVTARHLEHHWRQQNQADQVGNRHQPVQRV